MATTSIRCLATLPPLLSHNHLTYLALLSHIHHLPRYTHPLLTHSHQLFEHPRLLSLLCHTHTPVKEQPQPYLARLVPLDGNTHSKGHVTKALRRDTHLRLNLVGIVDKQLGKDKFCVASIFKILLRVY
jgi:hypothetical protein